MNKKTKDLFLGGNVKEYIFPLIWYVNSSWLSQATSSNVSMPLADCYTLVKKKYKNIFMYILIIYI